MAKKQKKSGFMEWYESYTGKRVTGVIYSVGAAVVIVGALFKILHWPGASQVLMVGMLTEAFLFMIGTLDKPHPTYQWQEVFPQLLGGGTDPEELAHYASRPRPTLLGGGVEGGAAPANAGDNVANAGGSASVSVGGLDTSSMKTLKDGIETFSTAAKQFGELGQVASKNLQLGDKITAACEATDKYIAGQESLASVTQTLGQQFVDTVKVLSTGTDTFAKSYTDMATNLKTAVDSSKTYSDGVSSLANKTKDVVSFYENQIAVLNSQTQAFKDADSDVKKLQTTIKEAVANGEKYKDATRVLADQIQQLNGIYGNMLNALS